MLHDACKIPGYTVKRQIGSGAMADVFLAQQDRLQREVALKFMSPALLDQEILRQRFHREALLIAKLNHPNIITIHDVGCHQSQCYIAMEYAAGGSLAELISRGLSPRQCQEILRDVARALECVHSHGIIHRDIKPANVLQRADGSFALTDFGVAKAQADRATLTKPSLSLGTPSYMSPEQVMGQPLSPCSDLYSLGIMYYEMLTGEQAYVADEPLAIALKHLRESVPRLPVELAAQQHLVDRLTAKEPADRIQSATELLQILEQSAPASTVKRSAPCGDTAARKMARAAAGKRRSSRLTQVAAVIAVLVSAALVQLSSWSPAACAPSVVASRIELFAVGGGDAKLKPMAPGANLASGEHYKIRFTPQGDGYAYVFQVDSSGEVYPLFPASAWTTSAFQQQNPLRAGTSSVLPSNEEAYELDDQTGDEAIYAFAFSQIHRPLEQLIDDLARARESDDSAAAGKLQVRLREMLQELACEDSMKRDFRHVAPERPGRRPAPDAATALMVDRAISGAAGG